MQNKISVCIPAYNEEDNILNCLKSVTIQSGVDIAEILVGINSSTDKTRTIVEGYSAVDPRVRVVDSQKGKANAWNALNACAQHNIRIFQDGDCIALPESYIELVHELEENTIVGASLYRNTKGKSLIQKIIYFPTRYVSPRAKLNGNLYVLNYEKVCLSFMEQLGHVEMPIDIINDDAFLQIMCPHVIVSKKVFISVSISANFKEELKRYRRMQLGGLQLESRYPNCMKNRRIRLSLYEKIEQLCTVFCIADYWEKILYVFVVPVKALIFRYLHYKVRTTVKTDSRLEWK